MIEEIWKDVPGYDGYYQVSNLGRVKSLSRTYTKKNMNVVFKTKECIKKPTLIKNQVSSNYYTSFSIDGVRETFTVMKLVGLTFLGETKKNECYQHKNKNTLDNRVENIEIVTHTISKKNDFIHKLRTVHNIEAFKPYFTKKMKKCFNCKELLTLDKFDIDNRKYQLKADKVTCKVCIKCEIERTLNDLSTVKFNYEINKFEVIKFENKEEVKQYYKLKYD